MLINSYYVQYLQVMSNKGFKFRIKIHSPARRSSPVKIERDTRKRKKEIDGGEKKIEESFYDSNK